MTNTDDVTHLRALLADATARAERAEAEAEVRSGRWCEKNRAEGRDGCGMCAWCCKWQRERADTALAACAEMRAALEEAATWAPGDHGRSIDALLSRPDLGAGMVVVERKVMERTRDALEHCRCRPHEHNPLPPFTSNDCEVIARALADLDALLRKGGG